MEKDIDPDKKRKLIGYIKRLDSILIAFSGGVDSTLLLAISNQVLGENAIAATAESIINPPEEINEARDFTSQHGIEHIIFSSDETEIPDFLSNGPERCYFCKKAMIRKLVEIAEQRKIKSIAHAANKDDLDDYRPGLRAAEEMGVVAPFLEAGINKQEIRSLAREMGLTVWNKPSMACLASRIPYGDPITEKKIRMIERAERFLLQNGFRQVRVRLHGDSARIEIEKNELERIIEKKMSNMIIKKFREAGFKHVAVDLEGYISGSLNRSLNMD